MLTAGVRGRPAQQFGSLTGRVWARADSTGLPGVMLIFLDDGTLVMDSCWETYRLARWQRESDSTLRWQEDAADIRATIRSVTDSELVLAVHLRDGSETQRYTAAPVPYLCPDMKKGLASDTEGAFRAIGTEPFWALIIGAAGLRFMTPEDQAGILWPPISPSSQGDTLHWSGRTERAAVDARIWAASCSDGMSDRVWPYTAVVRVDTLTHHGCAESRGWALVGPAIEGSWQVAGHRAPGVSAMSAEDAKKWAGRKARFSRAAARFGDQECSAPAYEGDRLSAEAFAREYRVSPGQLGLQPPIQAIDVRCAEDWSGPGGRLFVKGPDELLAPWDGVFLELRRE
jgi:uncharacterized membrane protein